MLKIKDKVINNGLKGQIIDIKEVDYLPGNPKLYLIKYPLFTFKKSSNHTSKIRRSRRNNRKPKYNY